jgi:cob(I)alamin adenosyltransferase
MGISTKRGDAGETALASGRRVSKNHPRVCAYGTVDELTSALGLCRAHCEDADTVEFIRGVQLHLIYLMGELASEKSQFPVEKSIQARHVDELSDKVKAKEASSKPFNGWLIPGESIVQAFFDHARSTCRRAEREIVALQETGVTIRPEILQYLNRLSDLLWLIGRG